MQILPTPADVGRLMNDVRISYFGRHRLAHELWEILTIGSPIRYESYSGLLCVDVSFFEVFIDELTSGFFFFGCLFVNLAV